MTLTRALRFLASKHPTFKSLSYIKSRLNRSVYGVCVCVCVCVFECACFVHGSTLVQKATMSLAPANNKTSYPPPSLWACFFSRPCRMTAACRVSALSLPTFPAIILLLFLKLVKLTFPRCPPPLAQTSQPSPPPWEAQERARARQQEDSEVARNA
jgi:hypothetical protein